LKEQSKKLKCVSERAYLYFFIWNSCTI
jgi:hypothetical protein